MNYRSRISDPAALWFKPADPQPDRLFYRGLLRWQALTGAERFVSVAIGLVPLWWMISWGYVPLFLTIGVFAVQFLRHRQFGLTRPSLAVVALLLMTGYLIALQQYKGVAAGPSALISPMQLWGSAALMLWYIQSHEIRVRLPVIAWSFSLVAAQAVLYWLVVHFALGEPFFVPVPNLMARLLGNATRFESSALGSVGNFLNPYNPSTRGPGNLVRYTFFFPHPTNSSLVFGFIVLLALDLKNRIWSSSVIFASSFLILVCQSRNVWVMLPIVVLLHWLITTGKARGLAVLLAILSITSFVTLSIPQVTDLIADRAATTAEATSNLRRASTDDRQEIYVKTWESITTEPPIIGHAVPGAEVNPGYEFARIGTESFILGTLLYKSGFLGTGLFLAFLISFLTWLHRTRHDRPLCCFLMLLLLGLASMVTEFLPMDTLLLILCSLVSTHSAPIAPPQKVSYA